MISSRNRFPFCGIFSKIHPAVSAKVHEAKNYMKGSPPRAMLALGGNLEDWQKKLLAESTGIIPYTAKNDYMFKAICQTNTYALKGLLSALLSMRMEEIREIDILNPIQLGETVHEKDCILDVKLKLNNNRIINIELQVALQPDWPERSLDYLCNAVSIFRRVHPVHEGDFPNR